MCQRRSFTESLPGIPARARFTVRLRAELGAAVAELQQVSDGPAGGSGPAYRQA